MKAVTLCLSRRSAFARNVMAIATGTALAQGVTILTAPLLSRLYTPSDFGVLAVFVSVTTIVLTVSSGRYELAIPLPKLDRDGGALLLLSLLLNGGTALLCALAVPVVGNDLSRVVDVAALDRYLWLLPIAILGTGTYQALNYWSVRVQRYRRIARTRISQAIAQAAVSVGLGIAWTGPAGLMLGHIGGRAAGTSSLLPRGPERRAIGRPRTPQLVELARRYRRFPLVSAWVGLLTAAGQNLPSVLLAIFYGAPTAGLFLLANRVIASPMYLVGDAVGQVYLGEAASVVRDEPRRLVPLFTVATRRLFLVGVVPFAGVAVFGGTAFALVFGEEWREAGVYAQIFTPMFLLQFVVSPLSQTLTILEKQGSQLAFNVGRLSSVLGSLTVAYVAGASPRLALAVFTAATVVTYVVYLVMCKRAVRSLLTAREAERPAGPQ